MRRKGLVNRMARQANRHDRGSGRKVALAVAALGGMAVFNMLREMRSSEKPAMNYSNRSGFPKSPREMRGAGRNSLQSDIRASEPQPWMDGSGSEQTRESSWPQNSDN